MPNEKLKKLYEVVGKDYNLPDYNTFEKGLQDTSKRRKFYDLVGQKYELPEYDKFNSSLFEETVVAPTQSQEIPSITLDSTEVANGTAEAPEWTGDAGKIPSLTKQTHDVFMKHALELPENIKLDARNSNVFINTFAKKMNLSPRELRKVFNDTVKNEMALKQLKEVYDKNPDDTDVLYKLGELHNSLGQPELAYEAYAALEGKLRKQGELESAPQGVTARPPNGEQYGLNASDIGNNRPDYMEQKVLPAIAGKAYSKWQMGDEKEARRLQAIAEQAGYKGQEFESVGSGNTFQPQNSPTRFGFSPQQGTTTDEQGNTISDTAPTPESQAMMTIADGLEATFGGGNAMTEMGLEKTAKGIREGNILTTIVGGVETLMGVAGMATPEGALFMLPLVGLQTVAPEVAEYIMPLSKGIHAYYENKGEAVPEWAENVTILADLALLGGLTHAGVKKGSKMIASREFGKIFNELPPEAIETLAKTAEKRWEASGKNPEVYGAQMEARLQELKPQLEELKADAEVIETPEVEPFQAQEQPTTLKSIKDGTDIMMDGKEGVLEYGDDMTPYFVDGEGKSTQIKVADKANAVEPLSELGIQVLPEITPEQVARATADAEQIGKVKFRGKDYFVSLDRVGNETPTGDHVFRVMPDGTMVDVFDSSPKPIKKFSQERKLEIINEFLESNGLPPRKLTAKVEAKPVEEAVVEAPVEEAVIEPTPQEILPANEPVSPAVEVQKVEPVKAEPVTPPKPPRVESEIETKVRELKQDVLNIGYEIGHEMEKNSLAEFSPDMYAVQNMPWIKPLSAAKETGGKVGSKGDINPSMTNELKGVSVEKAGEILEQRAAEDGLHPHLDSQDWRNIVIDILHAGSKESYVKNNTKFGKERTRVLKQDMAEKKAELAEAMKDLENADWEKLGFDSKKEFKQHVRDIKSGKQLEQYEMDAMDVVAQMDDATVDRLIKELDENFPITEEEISKFYEKHNIEEGSAGSEVSSPKITEGNTAEGKTQKAGEGELTPEVISGKDVWKSAEKAGSENHDFMEDQGDYREQIEESEYILKEVSIDELRKNDQDLDAYLEDIDFNAPKRKIETPIIIGSADRGQFHAMHDAVIDGFHRVEQAIINGKSTVEAYVPTDSKFIKTSLIESIKPTEVTPDTPLKITSKEKALKAVDDLEAFLMDLPGVKDTTGAERMGAPFKMEDAVKFFTKTLRESIEQGYKVKDAIERAIGKSKEKYSEMFNYISEEDLRAKARKQQEDAGNPLDKPVEQQFGASHASVAEVRKVMGLEDSVPISERVKRDVKTVMEEGRELASKIDLEELSDQVIYDGRSLNANEQAALVFRETELYNEIRDAENSLVKAVASGKKDATDLAQTRIDIAYQQQTAIMKALDIAGSEMGLAFRMRQVMNKRDYSLVSLEKRWTQASNGAKMPADVRKQFSDMVKDLEAKNKRYEELLEVKDKQLAEMALANIQESMGRGGKPTDKAKAGEKLRRLADRIEAGKINKLGGFKTSSGFDAAWDLSLTAVSETLRATGKLADAIESGIKKIRESDWYKELTDKDDFETKYREHLNKEYEKQDYDAPYLDENGDLKLDNQMLRDVVESLEVDPKLKQKNPQEFIDKVHEIVKEEFPDIERRKVQDAISGYGKKINSSLDDLQREVNSLKRDLKGISGLEDAKAGKGVLKSGYSPPKPTDMQREQQREIHKELKNHPQDQASLDKKWATALDRTKSMLQNSITDLKKRIEDIKAGTATPKTPREKLKLDHKAEMMQEVVKDLKKEIEALEGKKTLSVEQRIDNAIKAAERNKELYERRTKEIRETGTYTRDTPVELRSPKLDLARQIRDAAKEEYDAAIQGSGIGDAVKAARDLKASEDRVKDLENKIKKNQISYAAKAQRYIQNNPELGASLYKEKILKDVIKTMRQEQGLVEAHARDLWKSRKQRQITEIERRIRQKDYAKKVKPELELDIEMERLQAEMDRKKFDLDVEIEKEKYRNLSGRDKRYEMWLDIVNAPKSLKASMDFSAPLRQGAILSSRHPLLAAKTFKNMFKHWASEEYATNWHSELVRSDGYIRAKKSNLFISEPMARLVAAEERFSSNIAEKIPVWGRGVKASNRAYSGFLNELRMEVFNQHYEALQRNGFKGKQMQKELDAMAYLINNFTGRGSLGKAEIAAPLANTFFFAPRFVASRFNTLYNSLTGYSIPRAKQGGRLITPRARMEAYKAVGAYIGTGLSVLAMAKAAGADVEVDPRSSDFGKIKIGDTRYDIWAGHQQIVVLLSKIAMQASKSPRTGKVTKFGSNDNAAYTTLRFLRTKLSPPIGTLVSAGMKKNVDGTPFTASGAAWDMITPLIFSDMKSMYEEEGAAGVLRNLVPATFGVGVNTFEKDAIIKQSGLDPSSEKLMLAKKYQPEKANDDEVYVDGEPYKIPEADMEKIKVLRAKKAGEKINENYSDLQDLTDEEYASKVNSYYNEALKEARNEVLPDGWKNEKPKDSD